MYIIEIIPLAALPSQVPQLLSYFFNSALPKGSTVEVLIGNRRVPAIVISCDSVEDQKAILKKSNFQLKKISSVISDSSSVTEVQFKIALWLSKNYFAPLGLSLKTILPLFFLNPKYLFSYPQSKLQNTETHVSSSLFIAVPAKQILEEMHDEVKKIIKQKQQILIMLPEISLIEYFYDFFAQYYETAVLHSKVQLKKIYTEWNKISSGEAEIIIGTRQSLFAPFNNLGMIFVEDPANAAYKSDMTPKYATMSLAEYVSKLYGCDLISSAHLPDIKNYFNSKKSNYNLRIKNSSKKTEIKVSDMVQEIKSGNFSLFSRELVDQIKEYAARDKKILLFSSRRGHSGFFLCENCGFIATCPNCSLPMRIHKMPEVMLICHHCSESKRAPDFCPNCNSHKIKNAGIPGSQKLYEETERVLLSLPNKQDIFLLDATTVKNTKIEKELLLKIKAVKAPIVIATQMIFSHRYSLNFDLIGVPQADALINIPDFQSEEQLLYQFGKLLDFNPEKIIIQTYHSNNPVFSAILEQDFKNFYEKEFLARKLLWYPPYARLIKLSFKHSYKEKASYEARLLSEKLKMAIIQQKLSEKIRLLGPSPAFIEKEKSLYIYNIILKIRPEQKPDEILKFVPSHWSIDVDPKSIL